LDWSVTPTKVQAAIQRLIEVAAPRKVYLFGSFVRNEANIDSDLDVLVIVDDSVIAPRQESLRLRQALRDIHMPFDILVVTESFFNAHIDSPGLIYREIVETGRLVYERAA
jgi:predicted nucleotidyltransferase